MSRPEIRHTDSEKSSLLCVEFDSALLAFCEIQVCVFVKSSLRLWGIKFASKKKLEVWVFKNPSLRFLRIQACIERIKEWGIGVYRKAQNRKNNNRKPQNRNKFRSKLKTALVAKGYILGNTKLHRIANPKTRFYFCRKLKSESERKKKPLNPQ